MRTIKLIADDWGLSPQIESAICDAHAAGGLDGACVMMGQAFTERAIDYARRHPGLDLGLHLFANDRNGVRPLTAPGGEWPDRWPQDGQGLWSALLRSPAFRTKVFSELRAQMEAFRTQFERPPAFLNSHLHFHALPGVFPSIARMLQEIFPDFRGWIRLGRIEMFNMNRLGLLGRALGFPASGIITNVHAGARSWKGKRNRTLWGLDRPFSMDAEEVTGVARRLSPGLHEFFFHPGRTKESIHGGGKDAQALIDLGSRLPKSDRGE